MSRAPVGAPVNGRVGGGLVVGAGVGGLLRVGVGVGVGGCVTWRRGGGVVEIVVVGLGGSDVVGTTTGGVGSVVVGAGVGGTVVTVGCGGVVTDGLVLGAGVVGGTVVGGGDEVVGVGVGVGEGLVKQSTVPVCQSAMSRGPYGIDGPPYAASTCTKHCDRSPDGSTIGTYDGPGPTWLTTADQNNVCTSIGLPDRDGASQTATLTGDEQVPVSRIPGPSACSA